MDDENIYEFSDWIEVLTNKAGLFVITDKPIYQASQKGKHN
jgi:hypothetical protein